MISGQFALEVKLQAISSLGGQGNAVDTLVEVADMISGSNAYTRLTAA